MAISVHRALRLLIRRTADRAAALLVERRVRARQGSEGEINRLIEEPEMSLTLASNGDSRPYS